jgi:hypothetical protein
MTPEVRGRERTSCAGRRETAILRLRAKDARVDQAGNVECRRVWIMTDRHVALARWLPDDAR